jgi:hypothetical protein
MRDASTPASRVRHQADETHIMHQPPLALGTDDGDCRLKATKAVLASPPIRDHSMRLALVPPHPDCRAA